LLLITHSIKQTTGIMLNLEICKTHMAAHIQPPHKKSKKQPRPMAGAIVRQVQIVSKNRFYSGSAL